jgi:hypothetical protein
MVLVVQTKRLLPGRPASRLLRFARNDSVSACHCEEYSDEAISVKVRTGGNHLSEFAPLVATEQSTATVEKAVQNLERVGIHGCF